MHPTLCYCSLARVVLTKTSQREFFEYHTSDSIPHHVSLSLTPSFTTHGNVSPINYTGAELPTGQIANLSLPPSHVAFLCFAFLYARGSLVEAARLDGERRMVMGVWPRTT